MGLRFERFYYKRWNFVWLISLSNTFINFLLCLLLRGWKVVTLSGQAVYDRWNIHFNKIYCILRGVDRLKKHPSKEQQLSSMQHFILSWHAAMFVLHSWFYTCNTTHADYRWPPWYDDRIISYLLLSINVCLERSPNRQIYTCQK